MRTVAQGAMLRTLGNVIGDRASRTMLTWRMDALLNKALATAVTARARAATARRESVAGSRPLARLHRHITSRIGMGVLLERARESGLAQQQNFPPSPDWGVGLQRREAMADITGDLERRGMVLVCIICWHPGSYSLC